MKKRLSLIILLTIFLLMPINVFASADLNLSCDKETTLSKDKNVYCVLTCNSDEEIGLIAGRIDLPKGIEIESIKTNADWQGNTEENTFMIVSAKTQTDLIEIATFKLKTNGKYDGKAFVKIRKAVYDTSDFVEHKFDDVETTINVKASPVARYTTPVLIGVGVVVVIAGIIVFIIKKKKK